MCPATPSIPLSNPRILSYMASYDVGAKIARPYPLPLSPLSPMPLEVPLSPLSPSSPLRAVGADRPDTDTDGVVAVAPAPPLPDRPAPDVESPPEAELERSSAAAPSAAAAAVAEAAAAPASAAWSEDLADIARHVTGIYLNYRGFAMCVGGRVKGR